jgi:hypothetical protein
VYVCKVLVWNTVDIGIISMFIAASPNRHKCHAEEILLAQRLLFGRPVRSLGLAPLVALTAKQKSAGLGCLLPAFRPRTGGANLF